MRDNRVLYADVLRILAAFAVVVLHTAGIRLVVQSVYTCEFIWAAFFGSAVRWAVPVFVMLSGMLFLKKERSIDIKKLYTKNLLRLVTAFLFWSFLYNIRNAAAYTSGGVGEILWQALKQTPNGAMHLWFIFVIAGLYIILPLLKRMTDNMTKREAEYFLALNFVLTFLPTTLSDFEVFNPFVQYISKFEISFATGYIGLFVLGWYIDSFEHGKRLRVSLYAAAVLSFIYMFVMTVVKSRSVAGGGYFRKTSLILRL